MLSSPLPIVLIMKPLNTSNQFENYNQERDNDIEISNGNNSDHDVDCNQIVNINDDENSSFTPTTKEDKLERNNITQQEYDTWFLQLKPDLIKTEQTRIKKRLVQACETINQSTKEMNEKFDIPLPKKEFELDMTPQKLREYLKFLYCWQGLSRQCRPPSRFEYRKRSNSWLNGRRAPSYAKTLFNDIILSSIQYAQAVSKECVLTNDNLKIEMYFEILKYKYLCSLCSAQCSLHYHASQRTLICRNSPKHGLKNVLKQYIPFYDKLGFDMCNGLVSSKIAFEKLLKYSMLEYCEKYDIGKLESIKQEIKNQHETNIMNRQKRKERKCMQHLLKAKTLNDGDDSEKEEEYEILINQHLVNCLNNRNKIDKLGNGPMGIRSNKHDNLDNNNRIEMINIDKAVCTNNHITDNNNNVLGNINANIIHNNHTSNNYKVNRGSISNGYCQNVRPQSGPYSYNVDLNTFNDYLLFNSNQKQLENENEMLRKQIFTINDRIQQICLQNKAMSTLIFKLVSDHLANSETNSDSNTNPNGNTNGNHSCDSNDNANVMVNDDNSDWNPLYRVIFAMSNVNGCMDNHFIKSENSCQH